ncbi:MAG: Omp28-related outer membrane protein [Bacteroidales bacterium]|nr:Omp28-related outer membrane protein [Bacteroidales bacterium]
MKKTFRILSLAMVATSILFFGCKKEEEEEVDPFCKEQTKAVLVEEFTGINCGWCPVGHRIVNDLMAQHPGKVFGINVHAGAYAAAYTTEFGSALVNQSNLTGYPAGTVNRHVFPGLSMNSGTAMGRNSFENAANQILQQTACANIKASATIDQATRELTVNVSMYYTSAPNRSMNFIHVALLQDSIWGPQSNGQTNNPAQYDAATGKYCHMHMLRHLVTGQWGESFTPTVGEQIDKTFTYTIPAQISNEDVILNHLEVVAFITETRQEVINACNAPITLK